MVRDGFYEESATSARSKTEEKYYRVFFILAVICFVIGAFIASFSFTYVVNVLDSTVAEDGTVYTFARIFAFVQWFGMIAIFLGVGLIFWFLKNRFNVSYDYVFVEDELRITKVINGKKRKYLTTLKADSILQIGWVESDAYERACRGLDGKRPKKCTSNREPIEGKEFIYIVYSTSIAKMIYILECRRMLLEYLVLAAGRTKLEQK